MGKGADRLRRKKAGHREGGRGRSRSPEEGRLGGTGVRQRGAWGTLRHLPSVLTGISERGPRVRMQRKQASEPAEVKRNLWGRAGLVSGLGWAPMEEWSHPLHWALSQAFRKRPPSHHPHPSPLGPQLGATSHCSTLGWESGSVSAWALTSGAPSFLSISLPCGHSPATWLRTPGVRSLGGPPVPQGESTQLCVPRLLLDSAFCLLYPSPQGWTQACRIPGPSCWPAVPPLCTQK